MALFALCLLVPRVLLLADVGASGGIVRNDGQLRDQQGREVKSVRYLGVGSDLHVQFRTGGFSYEIFKPGQAGRILVQRIDVQFDQADTVLNGWKEEGSATGNFNYYTANGRFTDVPVFGKVRYKNAWKGIDVVFYSDPQSGFKYELEVSDARLLDKVRFLFRGIDSLSIAPNGAEIAIYAGNEQLNDRIPRSYLRCGNVPDPVQVNWKKINNNTCGFELKDSSTCALVVDPVPALRWASYLGGSGSDQALGITTATDGSVYICGRTASANIATTGSFQHQLAARSDAFLARLRPAGGSNARIWCTYYGGDSADAAFAVQADAIGHVYIAGQTFSSTNTSRLLFRPQVQTTHKGGSDAFIAKFNQNGRLIWSNFFGGNANEIARTLTLDRKGQPLVAGETFSPDTSLVHAAASGYSVEQASYGGNGDAFILYLDTAGKRLYSTYLGGSAHDEALTLAVNAGDTLFLGGRTRSGSLPNSINSIGSGYDGFVSSFLADGSALANRYFGGGGTDAVNGLFIDSSGLAVAGTTSSTGLGFLAGGHQGSLNRGASTTASDAFLVSLSTTLSPRWGTYYGGDNDEQGVAVTRDGSGYYFLLGNTTSPNGTARAIATPGSLYPNRRGASDAFLAKFNAGGNRSWGTYYGSNKDEFAHGFARGKGGNLFLAGETASDTGIARGGFQNIFAGTADAFTAGLSVCPRFLRTKQGSGCINDSVTLYSTLDSSLFVDNYSGSPYSWSKAFPSSFKISWTGPNSFSSSLQFPKFKARWTDTGLYRLVVFNEYGCPDTSYLRISSFLSDKGVSWINLKTVFCRWDTIKLEANVAGGALYTWRGPRNFRDTGSIMQRFPANADAGGKYYLEVRDSGGCTEVDSMLISVRPIFTAGSNSPVCNRDTVRLSLLGPFRAQSASWSGPRGFSSSSFSPFIPNADSSRSGTYRVAVRDSLGCRDTLTVPLIVRPRLEVAITAPANICRGARLDVRSRVVNAYGGYQYRWSGPASFSRIDSNFIINGITASYTGNFNLRLTDAGGCSYDTGFALTVRLPASIAIQSDSQRSCANTNYVSLRSNTTLAAGNGSITQSNWTLGDGSSFSGVGPFGKRYAGSGTYAIRLRVNTSFGCLDSSTQNIVVYAEPTAAFSLNASAQCLGANRFVSTNTSSAGSGSLSYAWSFGDGTSSAQAQPVKRYTATGNFNIQLVATNPFGCRDTIRRSVTVNTDPSASFTVNRDKQCLNNNHFVFGSNSTISGGRIQSHEWSFGGGLFSSAARDSFAYPDSGIYRVRLIVSSNQGCNDTQWQTVQVYPQAKPGFNWNGDQCLRGNSFSFTNTSAVGSGSINGYTWRFGNGSSSTAKDPTGVRYSNIGTYTVKLITRTSNQCFDSITKTIEVKAHPKAVLDVDFDTLCFRGNTFNFSGKSSTSVAGSAIASYRWAFGPDASRTTDTSSVPTSISYKSAGTKRITLITRDRNGCSDTAVKNTVVINSVNANFGINNNNQCLRGHNFIFSNTTAGASSYIWSFGDGSGSTAFQPTKQYNATGTYTVRLIAIGKDGCRDTISRNVVVNASPKAAFTLNSNRQCSRGNFFVGNNASTGASTYLWDYGDGSTRTNGLNGGRIYTSSGKYTMTLIATNSAGCKDTFSLPLTIDAQPSAVIGVNKSAQCFWGHAYNFFGLSTVVNDSIISNSWDFNNGSGSTLKNPNSVYYSSVGTYRVRLISKSNAGCLDTAYQNISLLRHPTASWSVNQDTQCINGNGFVFTDRSTPLTGSYINKARWFFGNGANPDSSNSLRPDTVKYSSTGTHRVTLIAYDQNGCADTFFKFVKVKSNPRAGFTINDTDQCLSGNQFVFSSASVPAIGSQVRSWSWSFGTDASPGTSTAQSNNRVVYSSFGRKFVTLTVIDRNGCTNSTTTSVIVYAKPTASFTINTLRQCFNTHAVELKNTSFSPIPGMKYIWDMGDGNRFNGSDTTYKYAKPGKYTIKIISQQAVGCNDSISNQVNIIPSPVADFTVAPVCGLSLYLKFRSAVIFNPGKGYGTGLKHEWDFGSGFNWSGLDTTVGFRTAGYYDVRLKVTSDSGCVDIAKKPVEAYERLRAAFTVNNRNGCGVKQIFTFKNESRGPLGNKLKFIWEPGDSIPLGKTGKMQAVVSNDTHIVHQYAEPGGYRVRLIVIGEDGCRDTAYETIQVFDIPVAGFALQNPCSNTSVAVFNNTTITKYGSISYKWDLGNGGISTSVSPRWRYDSFGRYTVKLVARTSGGCMDSTTGVISIYPAPWIQTWDSTISDCQNNNLFYFKSRSGITGNSYLMHRWRLSDKTAATGFEFSKSFADSGQFMVIGTARAATGCEASDTVIVHVKPNPIAGFSVNDSDQCFKDNWFQFTNNSVSPGLGGGLNFLWEFGDGDTSTLKNAFHQYDTAGLLPVILHVTNSYGCRTANAQRVRIYEHPVANFMVNDSAQCLSSNRFDISNLTVYYGGGGIANNFWEFGDSSSSTAHSPSHSYNIRGSYSIRLTVTSPYGCYDTASRSVHVWQNPDKPVIRVLRGIQCFGMLGALQATATGGQAPYTYLWNGNSRHRSNILDSIPASDYHLQIIDANGCESDASFILTQPDRMIDTINLISHVRCFGETSGNANVKASGGVPPYRFEWTSNRRTYFGEDLYRVPAGEYKLLVKDMLGCSIRDSFEIREPELLTLKATTLAPVSCFGGLAEVQLTAGGGIKPYRYAWNFVPNDSTRRQMPAGRHIVNVTDSNGCSRNLTFVVSQPNQLQALVDSFTDARCHGESSAVLYGNYVGGQMPVRYFWRDAANRNISSDRVAKGVPAGKYRLIVVDRNNCRDTMLTTIEPKQPDPVRVKALGKVDITCNGGNNGLLWVTAEGGNGGYRYTWFTAPVMRTDSFLTNLRAGTYRVEAVDMLGCRGDTSLSITDPPLNPIFTANDSVQICEYGTLNLQAGMNDGVIYRWIGPERSYPWGINPLRLDSVRYKKDMVFKAIGQDRNGCLDSLEVHVFVNKLPLVSIQSAPETVCYEQYAELRGIGAASYTWTRYNPYFAKMDTLGVAQRLPFTPFQRTDTGIYYVTGRLSNGCSATTRWKMKTGLDSVLASPDTMLCAGSIYIMRARGATNYQWITPQGRVINAPSIQLNRVNRSDSGMYRLRVTDIHNCSGTYQTNLRVWKQPLVNITDYTVKEICEGQDLELSLNTDGIKFHWRGPGLDVRDQRLSQYVVKKMHPGLQGVYTAIAESPEGCVDSASMPITVNRLPDATFNFIKRCSEIITEDPVEFFANSQEKDDISWELNFVPVSTERKFTYTFDKAGTYRLKHTRVTDKGCEHFEEHFMEVQDKPRIWLPTAFTPNNDFLNPVYRPVMTSTILNYKLTVYDRWGGKRYEWRGPNTGDITKGIWDGKINGILQPTDVYVIVVDYSTVCNENREIFTDRVSTDVMLIR